MRKTVIRFGLSTEEISRAIKELEKYKKDLLRKTETLRRKIAERIEKDAKSGFSRAIVDDLLRGGPRLADVKVSVDDRDNITVVIAKGKDAFWVEFGTGVHHNGAAGSSPHPKGSELGFTIGGYGKGMGKKDTWGYKEDGELHLTHGAPASMPMYKAVKTVGEEIADIVKEVFG